MHSLHFVKQAEGEAVNNLFSIPEKCKKRVYPIMPAHMELEMLRKNKMG
jgi:hypothetical protein